MIVSHKRIALLPIELPATSDDYALPFNVAVARRRTIRAIAATPLGLLELSNLLWTAFGMNRIAGPFGGPGRTAASASNSQEIDLYVALESAAYRYDAVDHRLDPVATGDWRSLAMTRDQPSGTIAPVQLIYVVDLHRLTHTIGFEEPGLQDPEVQKSYYFVDTGLIAGNVYLFAAAHGMACWFHNCDRQVLTHCLRLRDDQKVLFAQSVGWPASPATEPP
jgi:hypothetical protein